MIVGKGNHTLAFCGLDFLFIFHLAANFSLYSVSFHACAQRLAVWGVAG